MRDLRGPGMYLNLLKFVPVLLIYLLWVWTTDWVEHDTQDLNNLKFATWNSVVFFSGVLGLVLVLALPMYVMGLILLLLAYFIPLFTYVYARNQTVPDDQKVPILREYLRRWKFEVGAFFDGVSADSPDEELRRVAPGHPVFRIETG